VGWPGAGVADATGDVFRGDVRFFASEARVREMLRDF